ncbi:hypothetical protein cypCar_00032608 [Cyprinus carpio]|nr:hypothetical protein cypCar_00032608 [Cyprinus carpio]
MMECEGIAGIERFSSPGKGRGLRVTRAYEVGELLFSCPAYSYVLSVNERGFICEQCFTRKKGLAKCGKCKKAFYCNVNCQKKNWPMHKLECHAMCVYGENWCPSETVRLVARIIARLRHQRERSPSEKLLLLKDMEAHMEDMDNEKKEMTEAHIAGLHHFYSKHLDFPDHHALLTLLSQVHCNGFTVEDEELSSLGLAIFPDCKFTKPTSGVLDHGGGFPSRDDSIMGIHHLNRPGPEIYTSYIDLLYPTEDRIEKLRDIYYFSCDCKECTTKSMDMKKMNVRKLSDEISQKEIRDMVFYARKAMEDFRKAKLEKNILFDPFYFLKCVKLIA